MMSIVRGRLFASTIQTGELGGADLLRAGGAGHANRVLRPALLCRAAAGGQEALGHGCGGFLTALTGSSPLHHTCSEQKHVGYTRELYQKRLT